VQASRKSASPRRFAPTCRAKKKGGRLSSAAPRWARRLAMRNVRPTGATKAPMASMRQRSRAIRYAAEVARAATERAKFTLLTGQMLATRLANVMKTPWLMAATPMIGGPRRAIRAGRPRLICKKKRIEAAK
jgi:hypothetical protein